MRICLGRCGRILIPHKQIPGPSEARNNGRNLCSGCYQRAAKDGTLQDYPRVNRLLEDVLDDWETLRRSHTKAQAAVRVGMTLIAFERALIRGRDKQPV